MNYQGKQYSCINKNLSLKKLEERREQMKSNIISVIVLLFLIFNGKHLLPHNYNYGISCLITISLFPWNSTHLILLHLYFLK